MLTKYDYSEEGVVKHLINEFTYPTAESRIGTPFAVQADYESVQSQCSTDAAIDLAIRKGDFRFLDYVLDRYEITDHNTMFKKSLRMLKIDLTYYGNFPCLIVRCGRNKYFAKGSEEEATFTITKHCSRGVRIQYPNVFRRDSLP